MQKKKGFGDKLEAFFAGKGFYIVLFLCVAVIGVSAWIMLDGKGTDVENIQIDDLADISSEPDTSFVGPVAPEIEDDAALNEPEPVEEATDAIEDAVDTIHEEEDTEETAAWTEPAPIPQPMYVWPLAGEVETPYSVDALIYNRTMADWRIHDGIDVAAELGAQVMAAASGVVEKVYKDDMYGMTVVIDHGGGVKSYYSNLAETPTIYEGDSVVTGEIIGAVGNTALGEAGEVTHLHFAMTVDGQSVNPMDYLPAR
ncbi:MAG TPA: M23 family metallopeptidase [Clostridiales bacterium]|jgi:murein DD-endopeptidase MepM/ murein hydrolase activator NlpD|nr:M23 family metallopeptidase [Clostridiales bacterium]